MTDQRTLVYEDLMSEMLEVIEQLDGDKVAEIFNHVCANKAKYLEDGLWLITVKL